MPSGVTDVDKPNRFGSDADYSRFEVAERCASTAVARNLVVEIPDEAGMKYLGEELRQRPVKMCADAILVVGIGISKL